MLPDIINPQPARWQPFRIRHSFIPSYITFDLSVVASHILHLPHKIVGLPVSTATQLLESAFSNGFKGVSSRSEWKSL